MSDEFPFSEEEWQHVTSRTHSVMNADLQDQSELRKYHFSELVIFLDILRSRYGDHPVLLETQADFDSDGARQILLYYKAIEIAEEKNYPTLSIRLSLARLLIDEFHDYATANETLRSCRAAALVDADRRVIDQWTEMANICSTELTR